MRGSMTSALFSRASDPDKPYGDVAYADPGYQPDGKKRYPIDTEDHCRAAWSYINQAGNAGKYSPAQLKKIKARIMAAGKKHGIMFDTGDRSLDLSSYFERAYFEEGAHPRGEKGTTTGGQFVSKAAGKVASSAKAAAQKTPRRRKPQPRRPHQPTGPRALEKASAANHFTPRFEGSLQRGVGYSSSGDGRVRKIQRDLNRLGFRGSDGKPLAVDGRFGPETERAVRELQKRLGVDVTGKVDYDQMLKVAATKNLPVKGKRKNCTCRSAGDCYGCDAETRDLGMCLRAFEFRAGDMTSRTNGRTLEGYAAVFGHPAKITDMKGQFEERIASGAFTRSLRERQPVLQWEHGKDPRVGMVPIGSIDDLHEDGKGLFVRATLFDNPVVEPVRQAIAAQAVRGMSFRFSVPKGGDKWTRNFTGVDQREVRDADVFELGPVVHPAYDATSVNVRSLLAGLDADEVRSLVRELREHLGLATDLTPAEHSFARSLGGSTNGVSATEAAHERHRQLRLKGILP